jgi:hypothetical protein
MEEPNNEVIGKCVWNFKIYKCIYDTFHKKMQNLALKKQNQGNTNAN